MDSDQYRIYAIKYGHHERTASANFIGGDPHNEPMPLDYFVWAIVGNGRTYIVDTGFDEEMGRKRNRLITHPVEEGLKAIGIQPDAVEDVIITHMHFDHAGNRSLFPKARYHLQDREMAYCTGRCMCHGVFRHAYDPDDVTNLVRRVYDGQVQFHDGVSQVAPGISVHLVGGHTNGLQVVRVRTARGSVVLASDAAHLYANIDQARPFPIVYNVGDMLEGYRTIRQLAESERHVIPGHDPEVLRRFPPAQPGLENWIARLDLDSVW